MATKLQSASGSTASSNTCAVSFGSDTTAGSLVVVGGAAYGGALATCTDNATPANTYTSQVQRVEPARGIRGFIFSADNITAKTAPHTVTVTSTGSSAISVGIHEWSGASNPAIDQTASNDDNATSPTSWNTGTTGTTSQADEMVFGCCYVNSGAGYTITVSAPATKVTDVDNAFGDGFVDGYQIVAATGTQNIAGTISTGDNYCACIATFKISASQPTITVQPQSASKIEGQTATFSLTATGTGTVHYQWKDDGANVGSDQNSYTTPTLAPSDNNSLITCDVSDDVGSTTSDTAVLKVAHAGKAFWLKG